MALVTAETVLKTLKDTVEQINRILAAYDERLTALENPKKPSKSKANESR